MNNNKMLRLWLTFYELHFITRAVSLSFLLHSVFHNYLLLFAGKCERICLWPVERGFLRIFLRLPRGREKMKYNWIAKQFMALNQNTKRWVDSMPLWKDTVQLQHDDVQHGAPLLLAAQFCTTYPLHWFFYLYTRMRWCGLQIKTER